MDSVLKVKSLSKSFGGVTALKNISLEAEAGQIIGIIGPNGAGKTTLFNCLTGLYYPDGGEIFFKEKEIISKTSAKKTGLIEKCSQFFLILSLFWVLLFWSFLVPKTFFKVEMFLLGLFILSIRLLSIRGLKQFQIWAWGVMFVFLLADLYFSVWWMTNAFPLGNIFGTEIPLVYLALPWSAFSIPFSLFLFWQLLQREVRQLYGFKLGPDAICKFGIARTFQNIRLFFNLSVMDNVKIGSHVQMNSKLWSILFRTPAQKEEETLTEAEAQKHLLFVGLENRLFDLAGMLAYGEQRRLEIARGLASRPQLLLLDEPAAGMNPQESAQLIDLIQKVRDMGVTILIIEHDMKVMMNLADKIYVLDYGILLAHGTPDEIRTNPKVIEAYLGGGSSHVEA